MAAKAMNNWRTIWQKRSLSTGSDSVISRLLAMDGYEGLGAVREDVWHARLEALRSRLVITDADSVFEVGCGAGAVLYPFYQSGLRVGGIDFASNLVETARQVMPGADLQPLEAIATPAEPQYDIVLSFGVFLYFRDYDYAKAVLLAMLRKARRWVGVCDVPDLALREDALQRRRDAYGPGYDEAYQGLAHLYYPRAWFAEALAGQDVAVEIEEQKLAGYLHSGYRFNVYLRRLDASEQTPR